LGVYAYGKVLPDLPLWADIPALLVFLYPLLQHFHRHAGLKLQEQVGEEVKDEAAQQWCEQARRRPGGPGDPWDSFVLVAERVLQLSRRRAR